MAFDDKPTIVTGMEFPNKEFNYSDEYFELMRLVNTNNKDPLFNWQMEIIRGNPDALRILELLSKATNAEASETEKMFEEILKRLPDRNQSIEKGQKQNAQFVENRKIEKLNEIRQIRVLQSEVRKLPEQLTPRHEKLNRLAILWVKLNQAGKSKDYNLSQFLLENVDYDDRFDLGGVGESEFKKHLPKAYQWGVIDKDKTSQRYIPKTGD
jgi:hypothetical protein